MHRRAPMGLLSTGDEYNRRGELAITGLKDVEKVVDDMLIHSDTIADHVQSVRKVLTRCRAHGVTLNPAKFKFAEESIDFVGYKISTQGIQADPCKITAIADFPLPTNLTELRSFFGLVNQLGQFSKDVSAAAEPLRPLLRKSNVFAWNANHTKAFEDIKKALCAPPILTPFDANLPTILPTAPCNVLYNYIQEALPFRKEPISYLIFVKIL